MKALLACLFLVLTLFEAKADPNILIITCDNLGYGDLKSYRPESSIETPRLDQFAKEGARLTQFYTASPTCTVSRACLLTGRIPQRHGLTDQLGGIPGNYGVGLDQGEILIPRLLKSAPVPYRSGCFGKWNIGFAEGSRPTERGFDEFLGHASGNIDFYHHRYNGKRDLFEGIQPIIRDGEYSTDLFADATIDYIQRHGKTGKPWFCYLPFNSPHFPNKKNKLPGEETKYQAPDRAFEAIGLSPDETDPKKRYDAAVYALDEAIGRVLDSLKESGQEDNTFVFFMSDNGAFRLNREGIDVGINDPLRSGGVTCWEGGLRVPAMVRWPGKIKAGTVIDEPFWSPDLFVTCAALANAKLPQDLHFDGKNILPVLTEGAKSPHESFFYEYRSHSALRKGDWKIVREKPANPWQLFDLKNDPGESTDLSGKHPDKVAELLEERHLWLKGLEPSRAEIETLQVPYLVEETPAAGRRVKVVTPEYEGSNVHHSLYLPNDWTKEAVASGKTWPVIAEYSGNYFPTSGSSGEVSGSSLGYGLSAGKFIWVVLPFIEPGGKKNAVKWWGDEAATINYARTNIPAICREFGGDPDRVLLCGFSRGAIAVNYIGLHDDEIAKLWSGFIAHDHYDGVRQWGSKWGSPLEAYRKSATTRLGRLAGRPVLVSQNGGTDVTREYLTGRTPLENFTFNAVNTQKVLGPFPNRIAVHPHTDRWLLIDSEERRRVWDWVEETTSCKLQ